MIRKEAFDMLELGFTYEEFQATYDELVEEAIEEMKENAIRYESESDAPNLYVQIGVYENELIGRCKWRKKNDMESKEFYHGILIDIVDRNEFNPAIADILLSEDKYYLRTGKISKVVKDWFWNDSGDEMQRSIRDFISVVDELLTEVKHEKEMDYLQTQMSR